MKLNLPVVLKVWAERPLRTKHLDLVCDLFRRELFRRQMFQLRVEAEEIFYNLLVEVKAIKFYLTSAGRTGFRGAMNFTICDPS